MGAAERGSSAGAGKGGPPPDELRSVRLTLPVLPPSANKLFRQAHVKGLKFGKRVKTKRYKEFLRVAVPFLRLGMPEFRAPVRVDVFIWGGKGWMRNADVSNRVKAVEDALVKAGRIEDDNCMVVRGGRRWYYTRREHCEALGLEPTKAEQGRLEARCVVRVRELEGSCG